MKRFVAARTLSLVGDYAFRVTLILYLVDQGFGTDGLGLVAAAVLVPTLVFYLLGGLAADRSTAKMRILIVADILRGLILLAAFLAVQSSSGATIVIVAAILIAVGDGFFIPTSIAIIPEIVGAEDLAQANSWVSIGRQIGSIAGPAVAVVSIEALGFGAAIAFDAFTFLASAALLVRLRRAPTAEQPFPATGGMFRGMPLPELRAPFQYLMKGRWLLYIMAVAGLLNAIFTGQLDTLIPVRLAEPRLLFPAFQILLGIGALTGALFVQRVAKYDHRRSLLGSLALMAVALLGAVTISPVFIGPVFGLLYGFGLHLFNALLPTLLQERTHQEIRGRVISLVTLALHGLGPLGVMIVGILGSVLSIPAAGVILFVVSAGALAFTWKEVRHERGTP